MLRRNGYSLEGTKEAAAMLYRVKHARDTSAVVPLSRVGAMAHRQRSCPSQASDEYDDLGCPSHPPKSGSLGRDITMKSQLPTADEIMLTGSPDEQYALKHFLGKTIDQARSLFAENFLRYQEDLTHMGPVAFRYYLPAALKYVASEAADGESDAASSLCQVIESRLEKEPGELSPIKAILRDGIASILEDFVRYDCEPSIYGDVASRYRTLLSGLDALSSRKRDRKRRDAKRRGR